jgi:glycerol 3-phosphatase-2
VRPVDRYDAFLLDLDGVLYRGDEPVPGAAETVRALEDAGRSVVYPTNNSWRTPEQVAEKLAGMGIPARPEQVVTSAQATATMLSKERGTASAFVLGGRGIREALADAGIEPVDGEPDRVDVVVVGWDGELTYDRLRVATVLVGKGARLVATNADPSYPAPAGEHWPGAGALVAAVETGSGRRAEVVGKPHRPLFDLATDRAGTGNALVVGDRVETDIVGAGAAGLDAAMVLTGASTVADLLGTDAQPAMILDHLGGLLEERIVATVRSARAGDDAAVRDLVSQASLAEPSPGPAATVVAEAEGQLEATAATDVEGPDASLRSVAVREGARNQGLGARIVAAAVRDARRRGAERVWLLTESAVPFFERLGFDRVDRGALPSWVAERNAACGPSATAMRRDLVQA